MAKLDMQDILGKAVGKKAGLKEAFAAAKSKTAGAVAAGAKEVGAGKFSVEANLTEALGGGKIGKFIGGNWTWLLPIFLGMYAKGLIQKKGERDVTGMQTEHLQQMGQQMNPESEMFRAMMPAAQQENQMAQATLMSRLSGGGMAPEMQLARGEELIGNR